MVVSRVTKVWMGTEDPAQGEMVEPATETHSLSNVTDARDGATWHESALHQNPL